MPAQKDIFEKTDIKFTFKTLKQGTRKIQAIEFFWEKNPKYNQLALPFVDMPEIEEGNSGILNQKLFETLTCEFGISNFKAEEFIKIKDEIYIEEILEFVRSKIKSGDVENIPSFTVRAIERDFRAKKPEHEIKKEKRIAEQKRAEEEKKLIEKLREEYHRAKTEKIIEDFSKEDLKAQLKDFKEQEIKHSNDIIKRFFRESGIEHVAIRPFFRAYIADQFLLDRDRDFIAWAKKKKHKIEQRADGKYYFFEGG